MFINLQDNRINGQYIKDGDCIVYLNSKWSTLNLLNLIKTTINQNVVYPNAGIPISNGTGWGSSIVNNSNNWNTAYSWGNHALVGYLTSSSLSGLVPYTGATTNLNLGSNNLIFGTATGAGRIKLPDVGTTSADGISFGDYFIFRSGLQELSLNSGSATWKFNNAIFSAPTNQNSIFRIGGSRMLTFDNGVGGTIISLNSSTGTTIIRGNSPTANTIALFQNSNSVNVLQVDNNGETTFSNGGSINVFKALKIGNTGATSIGLQISDSSSSGSTPGYGANIWMNGNGRIFAGNSGSSWYNNAVSDVALGRHTANTWGIYQGGQSTTLGHLALDTLQVINGRILHTGTVPTTSDFFVNNLSATWTPTASVGHHSFICIKPIISASINSQTLNAVEINPTFNIGSFTGCQLNSLRVVGPFSETLLGTTNSSWANSFSTSSLSVGTVVGAIATVNTVIFGAYMYSNSNNTTQVGLSMYRAGSSAPTTGFGWAIQSRVNDANNTNVNWSWAQVQWETPTNLSTTSRTIFTNMDTGVGTQFMRAVGGNTLFGSTATVPNARVHIVGNSPTSGHAIQVDSSTSLLFRVANNGDILFGATGQVLYVGSSGLLRFGVSATNNYIAGFSGASNGITISGGGTGYGTRFVRNEITNSTSGTFTGISQEVNGGFQPTSGNASLTMLQITGQINQTGTANGITRGININQALTSTIDYRAIEAITGNSSTHTLIKLNNGSTDVFCVKGNNKVGFYGATPTEQGTTGLGIATYNNNGSIESDTFDGYTLGQVVLQLRNLGILA